MQSALVEKIFNGQLQQHKCALPTESVETLKPMVEGVVYEVLQKVMEDVALRLGYAHINVLEQSVCDLMGPAMLSAAQLKEYADRVVLSLVGSEAQASVWWNSENKGFDNQSPEEAWVKNPTAVLQYLWSHQSGQW